MTSISNMAAGGLTSKIQNPQENDEFGCNIVRIGTEFLAVCADHDNESGLDRAGRIDIFNIYSEEYITHNL